MRSACLVSGRGTDPNAAVSRASIGAAVSRNTSWELRRHSQTALLLSSQTQTTELGTKDSAHFAIIGEEIGSRYYDIEKNG